MRDTLLAKVGEVSQDQKTTLEKWIPETEREVRNQRFRASNTLVTKMECQPARFAGVCAKQLTRLVRIKSF